MPTWHAEIRLTQIALRRYAAGDAAAAFAAQLPYDGVASADIRNGRAWIEGMLVAGPPLTLEDRRQIEALLRKHGAVVLDAVRHRRMVSKDR